MIKSRSKKVHFNQISGPMNTAALGSQAWIKRKMIWSRNKFTLDLIFHERPIVTTKLKA